jgi:hypothetical protein
MGGAREVGVPPFNSASRTDSIECGSGVAAVTVGKKWS